MTWMVPGLHKVSRSEPGEGSSQKLVSLVLSPTAWLAATQTCFCPQLCFPAATQLTSWAKPLLPAPGGFLPHHSLLVQHARVCLPLAQGSSGWIFQPPYAKKTPKQVKHLHSR